jgi:hypothetical protein
VSAYGELAPECADVYMQVLRCAPPPPASVRRLAAPEIKDTAELAAHGIAGDLTGLRPLLLASHESLPPHSPTSFLLPPPAQVV